MEPFVGKMNIKPISAYAWLQSVFIYCSCKTLVIFAVISLMSSGHEESKIIYLLPCFLTIHSCCSGEVVYQIPNPQRFAVLLGWFAPSRWVSYSWKAVGAGEGSSAGRVSLVGWQEEWCCYMEVVSCMKMVVCNHFFEDKCLRYQRVAKFDVRKWWFSIWGPNRWGNQRPGHWTPLDSADFLWQAMLSMIEVELLD